MVAHALGIAAHDVVVECRRMGGGFGGKETQMSLFACVAARARAAQTGRAVKLRLDRDDDMRSTGKRHAFAYCVRRRLRRRGTHPRARPHARVALRLLRRPVRTGQRSRRVPLRTTRTGCPTSRCTAFRCKTNTVSDTAFRGFGGPQGMFADRARDRRDRASRCGRDPLDVRIANFYGTTSATSRRTA